MPEKGLSEFVQFENDTILWTASLILLNHLQRPEHRQQLAGKRVLELGSGLGHLGYGLSQLGCHVTCTELPSEFDALQASLEQQKLQKTPPLKAALQLLGHESSQDAPNSDEGSIQACSLEWGEQGYTNSPLSTQEAGTFDFIICSELYYLERVFPDLLWTLKHFSHPGTHVWSIFLDRPFSFMFFSLLADEGGKASPTWDVEAVTKFDDLGLDPDNQPHMHKFTRLGPQ